MSIRRKDTLVFEKPPVIAAWAAVGGKREGEGPLASGFDLLVEDSAFRAENCPGWEKVFSSSSPLENIRSTGLSLYRPQ